MNCLGHRVSYEYPGACRLYGVGRQPRDGDRAGGGRIHLDRITGELTHQPAVICDLPRFFTHTNNTDGLFVTAAPFRKAHDCDGCRDVGDTHR